MACILPIINRSVLRAGYIYLLPVVLQAVREYIRANNRLRCDMKINPPTYIFRILGLLLCMFKIVDTILQLPIEVRSKRAVHCRMLAEYGCGYTRLWDLYVRHSAI